MDNLNAGATTSRESPDHANTEGTKTAVAPPVPPPPVAPVITGVSSPTEPLAPNAVAALKDEMMRRVPVKMATLKAKQALGFA